jgi:hypothetical protein
MKRILMYVLFGGLNYGIAFSQESTLQINPPTQNPEYVQAMTDVVADIQSAPFGQDLVPFANTLERIAAAEPKEWLPPYWGAFCYMLKSFSEPVAEKKDQLLERAEKLVATADALNPNNDEVEVLKANIASARMAVDPQNRWQKYVPISMAAIAKAKTINPLNPRITLHEAQGVFYTPEAYGGGKAKALPMIKTAIEQFKLFKPASPIMPNWGADAAEFMLVEAQK